MPTETTAMPIASGRFRPGRLASPPACAIESKPMNEANISADAGNRTDNVKGGAAVAATVRPSRASSAAANAAWSKENPATITTPPRRNVRNISGTIRRS
jgi:hypothetical protein